ncbi:multidrug resistance-associated protein 1-like isoform X1 [Mercenaria mercenaria]|uniref:multidrug resistance-associated protein 1-like isoform X1 n=2 Tax=Mercenaria mercenaria TaxID=6596 RepID=UPI00234EA0AB|nr:multidrug resistance-associated protein 1-like isoform X1 [Mercenaria mercenaria]
MERIICSDKFWDTNLTWGNDRKYPEFTECFQDTVILLVPSLWLILTTPLYLYILLQYKDSHGQWSGKCLIKISTASLQLSVRYIQIAQTDDGAWSTRNINQMVEGVTLLLVMWYIDRERRKGFVTSGIQTIYWFLSSLCGAILMYSRMVKQVPDDYDSGSREIILMKSYLALSVVQFVLTWFADIDSLSERECKLSSSSFISRLMFTWFDGFMSLGYQRPIIDSDISEMMPTENAKTAIPSFEKTWASVQNKVKTETMSKNKEKVSLLEVIIKANLPILLSANLLKLSSQIFIISRPFITGLLVAFVGDMSQPGWKGYVYLIAGITCIIGDECIGNYVKHLCTSTALRLRVCLNSTIFKKSMRMTNKARSESTVGEIVNVLSQDVGQVQHFIAYFYWIWCVPFELVATFAVLYYTVDYAAVAGVCVFVIVMPLNVFMARNSQNTHLARMNKKDKRIKLMTEIMNGIKILKLHAWEMAFGEKILELRKDEISILRKQKIFGLIGSLCWRLAPVMMTLVTFGVYVNISANHMLTAETAFRAMATFGMLTHTFNALPHIVCHFLRSFVSIRRVEKFLNNDEIPVDIVAHNCSDDAIKVEDGTFTWDEKLGPCLKNINMSIPKGSLVAIVGTVGSGKSSLLSAILGEMEKDTGNVNVDGSVAYVPQQAWIQNNTLRDNVLFGNKYRKQTYTDVIDACSLKRDLDILPGKDQTEIGEKGINLSGGQKQRVSMARAVYFNSDIYLLDDPLSAVDAHVGKHIFDRVIGGKGLLRNKTRVLVTHGITWLPYVDRIFVVENGTISETGTYQQLMSNEGAFATFVQKYQNDGHISDDEENRVEEVIQSTQETMDTTANDLMKTPDNCIPPLNNLFFESDSGYTTESESTSGHRKEVDRKHELFRRSISRTISMEDKQVISNVETETQDHIPEKKGVRLETFDDKKKMNEERIKRESDKICTGKLIEDEEIETGEVQLKYLLPYFKAIGLLSCVAIVICFIGFKVCEIVRSVLIKEWTEDESLNNITALPSESEERYKQNQHFIKLFALFGLVHCIANISQEALMALGVLRAAKVLHEEMLKNLLRGPMSFFDTTPVGRIVQRFSGDIEPLDGDITGHINHLLHCIIGLIGVFVVIMMSLPKFIIMAIPIAVVYNEIQKRFVPIRRQLSRIESKRGTPVHSHFTESLNGVHVIRAFGMQNEFALQSSRKVTDICEINFHNRTVDRWMNVRLILMNTFCFAATTYFAIQEREYLSGALIGMAITYVFKLNGSLEGFVRVSGELEKDVVSIERIGQYSSIKQEAPLYTSAVLEKSWPENGEVDICNYSLRYREGLDLVLKNINVSVKPGEKVGIVGRTGAGKSSLTLGLFRLVEPAEGNIRIDKYDISELGLFDLRSNLTILPQEPLLFSGTLKNNLDPLDTHTDEEIFTALEHAHLKTFIDTLPDKLNYDCGEGGQNLSMGQRQLICLARSLLRKSSILVLDEATAAVDMKTDELIQNTIKMEFKDCTVLTIAHRLNTVIDYDRILVLEHGEIKEFDSPKILLENKNSSFYSMAKDAGLV